MTSTTVQLQSSPTTLDDEIRLMSHLISAKEPTFHDAPEQVPEDRSSLFDRLPESFQELFLTSVDPASFASLSLVNRHWRQQTNTTLLYAFHLARCTADDTYQQQSRWSEYREKPLPELKQLFARESKRRLFSSYSHRRSTFRLVAPSALSASAVPHGETFTFTFASNGARVAACSSSRMFVLDLGTVRPKVLAGYALQRRPTAVEISSDGSTIVVLAPEWRILVYLVSSDSTQLINTFVLDEPTSALALSQDGSLLVAAQSRGVEFFSLVKPHGFAPRRKLACESVNQLSFAENGLLLLGSNIHNTDSTSTVIHAPSNAVDVHSEAPGNVTSASIWLSQPLFPSSFGNTTHAAPIPREGNQVLAFDGPAGSFGLLDHQKMRFTSSVLRAGESRFKEATGLPTITRDACLVAVPISNAGVQIVGLRLDDEGASAQNKESVPVLASSLGPQNARWIPLGEKNMSARWVNKTGRMHIRQRLVVVGSDGMEESSSHESGAPVHDPKDCGVLHFFDFGLRTRSVRDQEATIDLSEVRVQPLEEGSTQNDAEHALARQPLSSRASDTPRNAPLARSVTSARRERRDSASKDDVAFAETPVQAQNQDELSPEERHLDGPYMPNEPRPQGTLQRNRTARAAHEQRPQSMPIEGAIRNPQGRGEIPDESDADNWVPPPPIYAKDSDFELPDELKQTLEAPSPPPKSASRKSASTPNLLLQMPGSSGESHSEASGGPISATRTQPGRNRATSENKRSSMIVVRDGIKRATSGPFELFGKKSSKGKERYTSNEPMPSDPADDVSLPSDDGRPPPPAIPRPRPASTMPVDGRNHRRSFIERPKSLVTNLNTRSPNKRSVSEPLERLGTSPFKSSPAPESPTFPSQTQVASLHRRQTSGSISSVRSESSTAPRAAMGAHRRTTNSMSPWSSTLMLNAVPEGDGMPGSSSRPGSTILSGTLGPSRPMSLAMNGSAVNGTPNAESDVEGKGKAPARLQEASMESSRASTSRGRDTNNTAAKRRSLMVKGTRLSSIPSMASLKAFTSRSNGRGESKSPGAGGVKRSGSRKLQRGDSVRKREPKGQTNWKTRMTGWKKTIMKSLESV